MTMTILSRTEFESLQKFSRIRLQKYHRIQGMQRIGMPRFQNDRSRQQSPNPRTNRLAGALCCGQKYYNNLYTQVIVSKTKVIPWNYVEDFGRLIDQFLLSSRAKLRASLSFTEPSSGAS